MVNSLQMEETGGRVVVNIVYSSGGKHSLSVEEGWW